MLDLVLQFKAGTSLDSDTSGVAALTLHMLDKGTTRMDAAQFSEQIEGLGTQIGTEIRLEHSSVTMRSLTAPELLTPAIELLTDMVAQPAFDPGQLARMKRQLQPYQQGRYTLPQLRTRVEVHQHLFAGHPYGTALGTTPEGIEAATVGQLRAFHERAYSANNLQIAMVGDLTREQAEAMVERITQALPQHWAAAALPPVPQTAGKKIHVSLPGASNAMVLAVPIDVQPGDPDFPALVLASEVLGSGLDSRLMRELRAKRGLTYGASTRLSPHEAGGLLYIEWEIESAYIDASQTLVAELLEQFIAEGPTQAELDLARQQLAGDLLRKVARNRFLAALMAKAAQQGLPADHINNYLHQLLAVTPDGVRTVLQSRLDVARKVLVSVGPAAEQQPLPYLPSTDQ
ncbi:pitrilysin family protein [Pseudomonas sp. Teo4]|uniref:M16 family metallopeptidase n=1 Tax=Pseudomonas sp. Teo4 TaxID=3064528 RepID=UPI002ACB1005|nr:pitrilysin family protein [Pseudomonas sp. Teo4]